MLSHYVSHNSGALAPRSTLAWGVLQLDGTVDSPWLWIGGAGGQVPVSGAGYDGHFAITESLGIEIMPHSSFFNSPW